MACCCRPKICQFFPKSGHFIEREILRWVSQFWQTHFILGFKFTRKVISHEFRNSVLKHFLRVDVAQIKWKGIFELNSERIGWLGDLDDRIWRPHLPKANRRAGGLATDRYCGRSSSPKPCCLAKVYLSLAKSCSRFRVGKLANGINRVMPTWMLADGSFVLPEH